MSAIKSYFATSYQIRIILGALFAAVVSDGIITRFLIYNRFAEEGNPFLRYWVGGDAFLTIKLLGGFLATLCLFLMYKRNPGLSIGFSSLFLTAYTFIICWNLFLVL